MSDTPPIVDFVAEGKKGGRPRQDGLVPGSPEARIADEARKSARKANASTLPGPSIPPRSVAQAVPAQPAVSGVPNSTPGATALPPVERVLPESPSERALALAPFKSESVQLIGILDGIASRYLPPPLTTAEHAMLVDPLSEVLWKYNGHLPCEFMLAVACLTVFGPRVATAISKRKELAKKELPAQDKKAA